MAALRICALLMACSAMNAHANSFYVCIDQYGGKVFSDAPCADKKKGIRLQSAPKRNVQKTTAASGPQARLAGEWKAYARSEVLDDDLDSSPPYEQWTFTLEAVTTATAKKKALTPRYKVEDDIIKTRSDFGDWEIIRLEAAEMVLKRQGAEEYHYLRRGG